MKLNVFDEPATFSDVFFSLIISLRDNHQETFIVQVSSYLWTAVIFDYWSIYRNESRDQHRLTHKTNNCNCLCCTDYLERPAAQGGEARHRHRGDHEKVHAPPASAHEAVVMWPLHICIIICVCVLQGRLRSCFLCRTEHWEVRGRHHSSLIVKPQSRPHISTVSVQCCFYFLCFSQ